MSLGDLVYGDFPTRYASSMQLFPDGKQLLANVTQSAADQDGWWNNSIGQEAGRYSMKGPLPGRYYGPSWLAPNSGFIPTVQGAVFGSNGADSGDAAAVLDGVGPTGAISISTPMPSVTRPRLNQQTATAPDCPIATWVSKHPLLAIGAVVLVYFGFSGGRK